MAQDDTHGIGERLSLEQARTMHPDRWLVFSSVTLDEDHGFVDGVLVIVEPDQGEAYRRGAAVKGGRATYYTGSIPYRRVTLTASEAESDALHKSAA